MRYICQHKFTTNDKGKRVMISPQLTTEEHKRLAARYDSLFFPKYPHDEDE